MTLDNFFSFKKTLTPFNILSKSQKNKIISKIKDFFYFISNGNILSLMSDFCNSKFSKEFIFPIYTEKYSKPILNNILNLYNNTPLLQKTIILSLIACQFSYKELKDYGFQISKNQFYKARKKNKKIKFHFYLNKKFFLNLNKKSIKN